MKKLAPDIIRQRLLIEGFYGVNVNAEVIEDYFKSVADALKLRIYGKPIIFSPTNDGKEENQGYDAFVPLIDSGISLYAWSKANFLSIIIYTCKAFDEKTAIKFTKNFFKIKNIEYTAF